MRLFLQPTDGRLLADPTTFFRDPYDGLDMSAFVFAAERRVEVCDGLPAFLRAAPVCVADFDPLHRPESFDLDAEWALAEGKWVTGVVGWFDVDWSPAATMTTSPLCPGTHWSQTLFHVPFRRPEAGERLQVKIRVTFSASEVPRYRWSGAFVSADGEVLASFNRDSENLFLVD